MGVEVGDLVVVNVGNGVLSNVALIVGGGVFSIVAGEVALQAMAIKLSKMAKLKREILLRLDMVPFTFCKRPTTCVIVPEGVLTSGTCPSGYGWGEQTQEARPTRPTGST